MANKIKSKPKKSSSEKTCNLKEPELFERIDKIFKDRGTAGLFLNQQVRMALYEWCEWIEKR